jgi:hypothetical protein
MNPWWNLPFGLFVALALWCRVGGRGHLLVAVESLLRFFGVGSPPSRQSAADFFGIAGVSGLVFVGWGDELAAAPDTWLLIDAVLTSLGLGLMGAWLLSRLDPDRVVEATDPGSGSIPREMMMMEVDEIPRRPPLGGAGSGPIGGGSAPEAR